MKVGFVGLGKLGLPVALAIEGAGHKVKGVEVNAAVSTYLTEREIPFTEEGIQPLLDKTEIELTTYPDLVSWSEIIFIAVQTPHDPKFEGDRRIPEDRADFNYDYLKMAVAEIAVEAGLQQKHITVVVISTCLPGTFKREIEPLLNEYTHYVYNPFFIAMGTVIRDFRNPEFVLIGTHNEGLPALRLEKLYSSIHDRELFCTDITTAEGIKVFYNTFITMKTVLANLYGEMAEKIGMDVDDITKALSLATGRIISPKYLNAGMGDGGGCHPRDNIALSYLAKEVGLSHNIFEDLMSAREDHAAWQASVIQDEAARNELPVVILGRAFKPETNIETGSPSVLVSSILTERMVHHAHVEDHEFDGPAVFFIGTQNERYRRLRFPVRSVVIDPFGYMPDQAGVEVLRLGRS